MYDRALKSIEDAKIASKQMEDVEIIRHMKDLNREDLKICDWHFKDLNIKPNDYVSDLIGRYILDLRNRAGLEKQSEATFTQIMRRGVRLGDSTDLIEELSRKTLG